MEERVPPATDSNQYLSKSSSPPSPPPPPPPPPSSFPIPDHGADYTQNTTTLRSGTYVVQVPKDQIYRVPPPENAAYLERQVKNPPQQRRSVCCCILLPILVLILLLVVLVVIVGISYLILKPENINFFVQNITVVSTHHLEYDVTLKAVNPNERMVIHYLHGGDASLSFKNQKISTGNPPAFFTDAKTSKRVRLVLSGSSGKLPPELKKSLKGKGKKKTKKGIALSLLVNYDVKMETGVLTTWSMKMGISCDLMVNTLAKGTRVLSQKCQSKTEVF